MRTFKLCAFILTAACVAYATDRYGIRTANVPPVEAAESYWMPMSFDIETVPPLADATEPAERRGEQQAHATTETGPATRPGSGGTL
jgi:hypothetical protein